MSEIGLHDGLGWQDVVAFAAGATTVLTFIALIFRPVWREAREMFLWWRKFQRDWDGEPAEPGRAAVPGVMQRLNLMDGQLNRNGGESLKDKVCDTLDLTRALSDRVTVIEQRQSEIHRDQTQMRRDIESLSPRRA